MQERIQPWIPAIFCATLAIIAAIGNLWSAAAGGSGNATNSVFILFMPMCFFFVGAYLTKLRNDNQELLARLDALDCDADQN